MRPGSLLLAFLLILGLATPALSHASLITSEPVDGAVVAAAPGHISLIYTEPVSPLVLKLFSSEGSPVELDNFRVGDKTVIIDIPPEITRGTHALSWRVISEDGHPIGGTIAFSIGAPSGAPIATPEADWRTGPLFWVAKIVLYAGLFVGVGGLFFGAFVAPLTPFASAFSRAAVVAGAIAAVLSVGLQGVDAVQAPLPDLLRGYVWKIGFGTTFGTTAAVAVVALVIALFASAMRSAAAGRLLATVSLAGVGLALAASGHASAAAPQWLMRPSVFIHAVGITFWVGALVPLGALLASGSPQSTAALKRFSLLIPFALAPLVLVGVVLAVVQVARPEGLWTTNYGRLLLVKLAILTVLFAMAAMNRWRLTAPAVAGNPAATRHLSRSITIESFLVLAVLGVAAGWRFTPPPRSLDAAAASSTVHAHHSAAEHAAAIQAQVQNDLPPSSLEIESEKAMAHVVVTPAKVGPAEVSIEIFDANFLPLDAKGVTLVLANAEAGIEPLKRSAKKPDDRPWQIDNLVIPLAGRWQTRIDILVSDFEMVKLEGELDVVP